MDATAARAALDSGEWRQALALVADIDDPEALEIRAYASYGAGDFEGCVAAWEALHAALLPRDPVGAARAAAMTAMFLLVDTGLMAPVRGWVRRAGSLLAGQPPGPAHALTAAVSGYERLFCGDVVRAAEGAADAIALGDRFDVPQASIMGRTIDARLRLVAGSLEEGIALLDEVGARLMAGEVDPLTTGMMFCELVCAAQGLGRHDLAREWTEAMERWRHGAAYGGINGRCRVHRAELLRLTGPADEAEEEALGACADLAPWMRREYGWPLVELGNIRLRRGDLPGAEEAFLAAHDLAWSPQPGLALLRLAQGDVAGARALIDDAVANPFALPWKERPPAGELQLAPLLEAQAEIAFAAGDAGACRDAVDRLAVIVAAYPSTAAAAGLALAQARLALLDGAPTRAVAAAGRAVADWCEVGAPFEAAEARLVLADAHQLAGSADLAGLERRAAARAFAGFGATTHAAAVEALLGRPHASKAVFRQDGPRRLVGFAGSEVEVPDLVGLRHIARLLAQPGQEVHVLDLVAGVRGEAGPAQPGLPALDDAAKASYRRRLAEVDEDIEDASSCGDLGRLELASRDREFLLAELRRAVGLGGRDRTVGSDTERARTSVARSVRYALDRLAGTEPLLAGHLRRAVRTGTWCAYVPDPAVPLAWDLGGSVPAAAEPRDHVPRG